MDYKNINDYEVLYQIKENNDDYAMNTLIKKYDTVIFNLAKKYFQQAKFQGVEINDFILEPLLLKNSITMQQQNIDDTQTETKTYVCITCPKYM